MRSEWVPVSAAALVTGAMALILGQMLNPAGSDTSPTAQFALVAEYPGRWLTMSILFFSGAAATVLGMPAVMALFQEPRGRGLGMVGIAATSIGCVGVGGLAALMLFFRALALQAMTTPVPTAREAALLGSALDNPALIVSVYVWAYVFVLGILLIALGLYRLKDVPNWVPTLLACYVAMQVVLSQMIDGTAGRVASATGLMLLAAGFTGIAVQATAPRVDEPLTQPR